MSFDINDLKEHCIKQISSYAGEKIIEEHKLILSLIDENNRLYERLANGRDYLMTVNTSLISVEDCLEAFGFERDGMGKTNKD